MIGRLALGLLAAAMFALAPSAASAAEPRASLPDIEDEVMCIVCGVPLELATEAPQANQERDLIRRLIAQGLTKDQIKDRLEAQYGPAVLAIPGDEGFDLAAWLVPGAAILLAATAIGIGLRRWRRVGDDGARAGPSEEAPAGEPLDAAEAERLDADLARYEL